jgi:uncharacterized membrane protein YbhN (UPF0104 family)
LPESDPHDEKTVNRLPITTASGEEMQAEQADKYARSLADITKYSLIAIVMIAATYFLFKKLQGVSLAEIQTAFLSIPPQNILLALLLTCANFCLLTGYDLIAVRYLKKEVPLKRVMAGAIVGYALSNIFGWLVGGTTVRYRLYRRWGFAPVEIIAFVTILSMTFWLGMFLLAGIAFALLPIQLPERFQGALWFDHHVWGWIFLGVVAVYLIASVTIRKPIPWKSYRFSFPPPSLSLLQLMVSAGDFLLTSAVLYVVIPPDLTGVDGVNFSTVLVSYLTAMILVVAFHAPGGFAILETTILSVFHDDARAAILAALLMFRLIYYILPAIVAGIMWAVMEARWQKDRRAANAS